MSIDDSVSKYKSESEVYNKYISEFEEMSKSKTETVEKCKKLFESFRTQLEEIGPSLTSGAPPSPSQIKEVLFFLKAELNRKTTQLAKELIQSNVELLDPEIYKKFPHSLRLEIATCCASDPNYERLPEMIKTYGIRDQGDICQLVKIRASFDVEQVCKEFQDYEITDELKRLEVAKYIVLQDIIGGTYVLNSFHKFGISDPNNAFELMKTIAQNHPEDLPSYPSLFLNTIKDPQRRYEILSIMASKDLTALLRFIKNPKIVDPDRLFHLVQIGARDLGVEVINHLDKIGIKDRDQIKVIYRLCYENAMKTFYLQEDKESITSLSFPDHIEWKFSPALKMWLDRAIAINIPIDFETEVKKAEYEEKIYHLLSDLIEEGVAAGFSESRLKSLSEKVILKADSLQQQMKYLIWLGDFLIRCGLEPGLQLLLEDEAAAPTFEEVFKLTNPILQVAGTTALTEIYKNEDRRKAWLSISRGQPEYLLLTSLLLTYGGIQEKTSQRILDSLKAKRYTDYKLLQSINEMICFLTEKSGLAVQDQSRLLEQVLIEPEKEPREKGPDYQKRKQEHRSNQEVLLSAIPALILFEQSELLQNSKDAKTLVDKWGSKIGDILETFGIHDAEMIEKFKSIFCESKRYPNGLLVYASRLQMLPKAEKLNEVLGQFIKSVLDGTFLQIRYEFTKNPHLKTIFNKNPSLLEKWKTPLPKTTKEGLTLEDTDQWEDLMLLGTEVRKSCQHLTDDPSLSKCLMAYILDGKNRAIVVKNKQGKIVARSVLRILWDPQKKEPVLFMEKLYKSQDNPVLVQMVRDGCEQKARAMGLSLVGSLKDDPTLKANPKYPAPLEALGGPVPYEYVDAIGGVKKKGKFVIPISRTILAL